MPELTAPTARLHRAWLDARDDFGPGVHQDGSGLRPADDVDPPGGFAAWVRFLLGLTDPAVEPPDGFVHCTFWWITEGDTVLGSISVRHELNDFLLRIGGHVGYSVRPSARRRGLATWALGEVLGRPPATGLDRVLVTCLDGNDASRRVIEHHGGVLEDVRDTEAGRIRRYWFSR